MKHTILGAALGLFALAATPAEAQTFQTCAVFTGTHLTGEYCGLVTVTIESETQGFVEIEWGYFGEHAAAETGYDLLHIIMETEQLHIQQIQVSANSQSFVDTLADSDDVDFWTAGGEFILVDIFVGDRSRSLPTLRIDTHQIDLPTVVPVLPTAALWLLGAVLTGIAARGRQDRKTGGFRAPI